MFWAKKYVKFFSFWIKKDQKKQKKKAKGENK